MLLCNNKYCHYRSLYEQHNPCVTCNESYLCLTRPDYDSSRKCHDTEYPYLLVDQDNNINLKIEPDKHLIAFQNIDEIIVYLQLRLDESTSLAIVNLSGVNFCKYTLTLSEM